MRMFARDAAFYRRARVDETNNAEALRRLKELEAADRMRERFTLSESLSAPGVGRSTCYERKRCLREEGVRGLIPRSSRPKSHLGRQWTTTDAKRVLDARRRWPQSYRPCEPTPEHEPEELSAGRSPDRQRGRKAIWHVPNLSLRWPSRRAERALPRSLRDVARFATASGLCRVAAPD